jgi:hypothetical protein
MKENSVTDSKLKEIIKGVEDGSIVPYLGPASVADVVHKESGVAMASSGHDLILAMNNGQPMSDRLMYEFPRAAMHQELKRGRSYLIRFLNEYYDHDQWTRAALHDWLAEVKPAYVIDINRDTQLQDSYSTTPHTLIRGISRIAGTDYRFVLHHYDSEKYTEITLGQADLSLPMLYKPMGSPVPAPTYIASDADYVDFITELMGGFGLPSFIKKYREGKQYLLIGLSLTRDTERMVMSDIIYGAGQPSGWALIPEPNKKEERFCARRGIEIIQAGVSDLLQAAGVELKAA